MGSSDKVEVTIGETNVDAAISAASATRHIVEAKKLLKHPSYVPSTKVDDIALIYLPVNTVKSANVAIGYLYLNDPSDAAVFTAAYYNRLPNTVGWGQTGNSAGLSPTLKYSQATIITVASCAPDRPDVTAKNICTSPSSQVIVSYFI
jgi:hypothetical protein